MRKAPAFKNPVVETPRVRAAARRDDGPDFLCVGQQKAGTGWLYDQLQFQPGFWMPAVKELHFLDRSFPNKKIVQTIGRALSDLGRVSERRVARDQRALDERDRAFFQAAQACIDEEPDLERYASLFAPKGEELSGDITPSYCNIDVATIDGVVTRFPNIKVLILLRDPVKRALSHIAMVHRTGKMPEEACQDLDAFKSFLSESKVTDKSLGTRSVRNWKERLPPDQFACYFFDDLVARPEWLRKEILGFVGAAPEVENPRFAAGFNRKANEAKPTLSDEIHEFLQDHFTEELEEAARMLGGHAEQWLARYRTLREQRSTHVSAVS